MDCKDARLDLLLTGVKTITKSKLSDSAIMEKESYWLHPITVL
jgi:hypothetical protein